MTEREVEALLGTKGAPFDEGPTWCSKRWQGDRVGIHVYFGKGEGFPVVDANFFTEEGEMVPLGEGADGFLERLRRLLPW